jgi:hypothetical protein
VIDASVARSASLAENPTSIACRQFFDVVLSVCHRAVLSREVEQEWINVALRIETKSDEVRIRFLKNWMAAMQRRGKLLKQPIAPDGALRSKINHLGLPEGDRQKIMEDVHLVEAALSSDLVVVSRDDEAEGLLQGITHACPEIRKVVWCNPVTLGDEALDWLKRGARSVKVWQLGSTRPD